MKKFLKSLFGKGDTSTNWSNQGFIDGAFEGLQLQTEVHKKTWGLGQEDQWNVDMQEGKLFFDFSDGSKASTDIQIIGTYNSLDETFLWGWDHPSVSAALAKHAKQSHEWGIQNNEPSFTEVQLSCSIEDVWKIAAAVNRITEANGVYKGDSGTTQVFMTLGKIEMNE